MWEYHPHFLSYKGANMKVNIDELMDKMSLEDKILQMTQLVPDYIDGKISGEITGNLDIIKASKEQAANIGSVLGVSGAKEIKELQDYYLENSKHKIPLLVMNDVIHGYKTIFPIPLAIGAAFDVALAEEIARVSAIESAVAGSHVTFSPMVDLVNDPRFGRVMESTGEDSYLNSMLAKAFVRGYQGEPGKEFEDPYNIVACVKHFAGYGKVTSGRDYNHVEIPEYLLRQSYLPAYKSALDEGCRMVMTSFNALNGIPSTMNRYLMNDILRDEWGFEGVVISDWNAVGELITHGLTEDSVDTCEKAIKCNVDIEMMSTHYLNGYKTLIEKNILTEEDINICVRRILKLKEELGLFENPYRGLSIEKETEMILCKEHKLVARKAVENSCVLLKNENHCLPLNRNEKLAVIGPFANSKEILGAWAMKGENDDCVSVLEGLLNKGISATYDSICDLYSNEINEEALMEVVKDVSDVVVCVGEHQDDIGEGTSKGSITLSEGQEKLIQRVKELGKNVTVILFNGRPLDLKNVLEYMDALVIAWFPGIEGGNGIANLLLGDANFSAKLPMSFPYDVGQCPISYNSYRTGRPKPSDHKRHAFTSSYIDMRNAPLFHFGEGLSYSCFEYSNIKISDHLVDHKPIEVSVDITNSSEVDGVETVQMYIGDKVSRIIRPMKELKGFKKVHIAAHETKTVAFEIDVEMLKYYDNEKVFTVEDGEFDVFIGTSSVDHLKATFRLITND
jgi:beta-glucosidase